MTIELIKYEDMKPIGVVSRRIYIVVRLYEEGNCGQENVEAFFDSGLALDRAAELNRKETEYIEYRVEDMEVFGGTDI